MPTAKPPDSEKNKEVPILPRRDAVKIKGNLLYNESAQAWSIIRLKKEVLNEFPELKDKRGNFQYTMVIPHAGQEIDQQFLENIKSQKVVPIFLSFSKIKDEGQ
jgi:hypothetical protein